MKWEEDEQEDNTFPSQNIIFNNVPNLFINELKTNFHFI